MRIVEHGRKSLIGEGQPEGRRGIIERLARGEWDRFMAYWQHSSE